MAPIHDHPVRLTVRRYTPRRRLSLYQRTVLTKDGLPLVVGDRPTAQRVAEILTGRTGIAHFAEDYAP